MSMRSGQPGINSVEYGSYIFSITDIEEQEKIKNEIQNQTLSGLASNITIINDKAQIVKIGVLFITY